jgi:hypothetical protein
VRKSGVAAPAMNHLSGLFCVTADDLDQARTLLDGNPVFDSGGIVEIGELPRTSQTSEAGPSDRGQFPPRQQTGDLAMESERLFENKSLDASVIHDCSMVRSTFDDVDLSETTFTNVNLRGAKFENVNLAAVAINDANIDGLTIFGHSIQVLIRAELARLEEHNR